MNIYDYIAANDPYTSKVICNKFGYSLDGAETTGDLAIALEEVVRVEGEPAFKQIVDLHPDKELIIEMYGSAQSAAPAQSGKCGCSKKSDSKVADSYIQAAGGTAMQSQGNLFLIAAALILAVAIISKDK